MTHPEAIIYMSRATPRKAKGTAGWRGSQPAGLASGRPFAHQDHGPGGPDGPEGVEELLRRRRAPSRVSGGGSSLAAAGDGLAGGTMWANGPGKATRARGRSPSLGSAPLSGRGSTTDLRLARLWFIPAASAPRDPGLSLSRARRPGGRRAVVTYVVPSRASKPVSGRFAGAGRSAANATNGIIVGVASACFRFAFDQRTLP